MSEYTPGYYSYQVYGDSVDWKNFLGQAMPEWEELPARIKIAWEDVARAKDASRLAWRDKLDERNRKILDDAERYCEDPFGDIGHAIKLLVGQLAVLLDQE
jgi:hypothetical protein